MPLQATSGAASYEAFGGGVPFVPTYIEDVFSTYLYTGNGSTQTITNGIDLAGKGGLWWGKQRNSTGQHWLLDSARAGNIISTNLTDAQTVAFASSPFTSTGISFTSANSIYNGNGNTYVGGTFRKQPKFFDVVTYTGDGTTNRSISHNLGSAPGCVIVKSTSTTGNWSVYHRGVSPINNNTLSLQSTSAASDGGQDLWGNGATVVVPTSTVFNVSNSLNDNGTTYVAYLFAHNAGGFGLTGTDNVISCGSYTGNGSTTGPVVTLGYEPQWLLVKNASASANWALIDNMRGFPVAGSNQATLLADSATAELNNTTYQIQPNATGFQPVSTNGLVNANTNLYIYIAIRRGPMKVPTSGTSVFEPVARTGTGATATVSSPNFPVDLAIIRNRPDIQNNKFADRLRGKTLALVSDSTAAEGIDGSGVLGFDLQNGITVGFDTAYNKSATPMINWFFRRAPGFFDEVCYLGSGSATTQAHNLGVVPELMIVKQRSAARDWVVYIAPMGNNYFACLNDPAFQGSSSAMWNDTTPTNAVFTVGTNLRTNVSGGAYVAYLFASCPGVSKVGSYTGNGTTLQVNCGFTAGARFVLIKRTDSTGDWYVWDSARGIVAGNDPYLLLNSTAAEVTSTDYVDTYSAGFEISSTAPAAINASGGSFIFLAIA